MRYIVNIIQKPITMITLIYFVILSIGVLFRFYKLDLIPFGIYSDEAYNGSDALLSLLNHDFKIFYFDNNGREGLFIWLVSIVQFFMKPSAFSLRLAPALIGTLTVITIPFMICYVSLFLQDYKNKHLNNFILIASLSAMFFIACNYWHINFSRIAFRGIVDPLLSTLTVLAISLSFLKPDKPLLAILAGVICSLGFYGYGSYKFMIFPLFFLLFFALCSVRKNKIVFLLFGASAILIILPFLSFIIGNYEIYFSRFSQVSVFQSSSPFIEFCISFLNLVLMLFIWGDPNLRHNLDANPQLHPIVFIFFAIGILNMIMRLIKKSAVKKTKSQYSFELSKKLCLFFLLWWVSMIIPAALTFQGQPHSLRGIGMIVPTLSIAGIGVALCVRFCKNISLKIHISIAIMIALVAGFSLCYNSYINYFKLFPKSPNHNETFNAQIFEQYQSVVKIRESNKIIIIDNNKTINSIWGLQILLFLIDYDLKFHNIEVISINELSWHHLLDKGIIIVPGSYFNQIKKMCFDKKIIVY